MMNSLYSELSELAVFVYGTLKPEGRYHRRYCQSFLSEAMPAQVKGRLYDFPQLGYPAMTTGDDWVKGYLLLFRQHKSVCQDILRRLDELEGYAVENADNDYQRCWVPVYAPLTDNLHHPNLHQAIAPHPEPLQSAWVYRMSALQVEQQSGIYLPSGEWPDCSH
jgi:gamma-glutamylcyclotransferase (GGCT)/AIG2-like uncharacterized protein YtfP